MRTSQLLQATRAYSPAAIGKAYLRLMRVTPILQRQPDFPADILGAAMSSFYGGRAECRIRRLSVPVVYVDFLSMYPTVNCLFQNWSLLTAQLIAVADATAEVQALVQNITLVDCFRPEIWPQLRGLAWLQPDGDVLPVRASYAGKGIGYEIGINPVTADHILCYTLPDLVASKLICGRVPHIQRAVRFEPVGQLRSLRPVRLRGEIEVDPRRQDFFRAVIEERKRVVGDMELAPSDRKRLDGFLKVLGSSTSFGIFGEMVRQELPMGRKEKVAGFGLDEPFQCAVNAPERPGEYCFPPLAAMITGGARLMLAMLERCVTDLGGIYAMCDTDSMAIVASEDGGLLPCPGGPSRTLNEREAIRALSWADEELIRERFAGLNPYDREVSGSILKKEDVNLDPISGKQRRLYCYAISAKRYALYNLGSDVGIVLRKFSEHGLGHLLNPHEPVSAVLDGSDLAVDDDEGEPAEPRERQRRWIAEAWQYILERDALGRESRPPSWTSLPAVSRITASSPVVLRPFRYLNDGHPYADQVKPYNFLLAPHVAPFGLPHGLEAERFQLVAAFEKNPRRWLRMPWYTLYPCLGGPSDRSAGDEEREVLPPGTTFRIATRGPSELAPERTVLVRAYGVMIEEYRHHPEAKSLGPDGYACSRDVRGLLRRRPVAVRMGMIRYIGKESNRLEDVQAGLVHDLREVVTEYPDPALDSWRHLVLPELRKTGPAELRRRTGLPLSTIKHALAGRSPSRYTRGVLLAVLEGSTLKHQIRVKAR